MEHEPHCTHCGAKTEYMGTRAILNKFGKQYDSRTGKLLQEHWWECPNSRSFFSGVFHSVYTRNIRIVD